MESKKGKKLSKANSFSRKLVCINYPGIVNNVDAMIETLGGMRGIETYVGSQRRTMEIKFRPKDVYCKPIVSDVDKKPGILIKVAPREPIASTSSEPTEPEMDYEVIGITALSYSFNKLCDFQYLPLVSEDENETSETSLKYIYNKIICDELPNYDWIMSEESKNMPLYLPPAIFSRSDNSKNCLYFDRSKFYESRFKPEYAQMLRQQEMERKSHRTFDQKIIAKKSGHGAIFNTFNDPVVPGTPPRLALQFLNLRYTNQGAYENIKALFDRRPIWSRSAILFVSKVPKEQLKFILPAVAYHCHNGPWRVMWIKYGYDPKIDPSARIYQTFDFRIFEIQWAQPNFFGWAMASFSYVPELYVKAVIVAAGLKVKVHSKRYYKTQRYLPSMGAAVSKVSLNEVCENKEDDSNATNDSLYVLKPGIIPPARQMFYQYCDIQLPEIQSMLNRLPPVLPGTQCDFKNGWLPNKFTDQCREIASKYITEQVQKEILEENKKQTQQEVQVAPDVKAAAAGTSKEQELLEISDSGSDYLLSDDEDTNATTLQSKSQDDEEDDGDEIDLEAAEDVNKILGGNYEALEEFNRLVYDSDSE